MKKILFIIILIIISLNCFISKPAPYYYENEFSLKDDINQSIIDGFYNGDTNNIGNEIYLLK